MIGMITSASKMLLLKANVAIIQPRLRVWIVPMVSNVESSNMAALPQLHFSRAFREDRKFQTGERVRAAPRKTKRVERMLTALQSPTVPFGTTVLV
jgi:hypothetical protein